MLKRISSNDPRFKSIEFGNGINLVVADVTKKSTSKDTRNGLGKTTLIEILHFCLGASYDQLKTLKAPELRLWNFTLDFEVGNKAFSVTRSLEVPQIVRVSGDIEEIKLGNISSDDESIKVLSLNQWNTVLGNLFFDLPLEEPIPHLKYRPSFRGLISYFMRRSPGSYLDPFSHFSQQKEFDRQVSNTFLLGLNYEYAREFQLTKDKDKEIKARKKQAEQGTLPGAQGRLGELKARKVPLQEKLEKERLLLETFQVNPHYSEIEKQAADLTKQLHELSEMNISDDRLRIFYEDSLEEEDVAIDGKNLLAMYEQLGAALPELVVKRFDEVKDFHIQLLQNRRRFLSEEISRLQKSIDKRNLDKESLSVRRSNLMNILKTQGALAEYTRLQENVTELSATLKAIENQIQVIMQVTKDASDLKIEQEVLFQKTTQDFEERQTVRDRAISLFNENSRALYNRAGELIVEVKRTGYKFGIEIERSGSEGVGHMKVLCYDLTLQQLAQERKAGVDVLVHDSTMFDGVDERQRASGILLMQSETAKRRFQYILCMNTDNIPKHSLLSDFDVDTHIVCRLTDKGEDGGILGFRLRSTEKSIDEGEELQVSDVDDLEE